MRHAVVSVPDRLPFPDSAHRQHRRETSEQRTTDITVTVDGLWTSIQPVLPLPVAGVHKCRHVEGHAGAGGVRRGGGGLGLTRHNSGSNSGAVV